MFKKIFLLSYIILLLSGCSKDDCTKTIVIEGYNAGGGAYVPGSKTEVPCDFPEPEPIKEL
jgi:hypothetical protein